MLNAIRGKHAKKILWVIAGAVITAFILSGASSFLEKKGVGAIAEIRGQKVTIPNFKYYIDLARLDFILFANINNETKAVTSEAIIDKAGIYYRLLWKAKEEGIEVSDEEVMHWINRNFSPRGKFDQASYQQYIKHISRNFNLTLTTRSFEEQIRKLILIDKLWETLPEVSIGDEEVRLLYAVENQKAKITYLFIPYEKFRVDVGIKPNEIEKFYQSNKAFFQREPAVNIEYVLIPKDDTVSFKELDNLAKLKTLDELKEKTSFETKQTGFIKKDSLINEVGWKQEITQRAFGLKINQISPPIDLGRSFIIVGKEDERQAFIPSLGEIEAEVKEALIDSRAKEEAKRFSSDLLKEINEKETNDLSKFANKNNVELKDTDFFKYYDYIEGLGLDNRVSEIVFSLEVDAVHSEIVALDKGVYILQLKEKTSIDEADFQAKRENYHDRIGERKLFIEKLKFIAKLNQEIILKLPN